ncbi:hypothetical protein HWI79_2416 [Cryptosporidium felis]|nr:hypothetical protein HWI79_2416 [Cryptosporidium felis]
MQNSEYRPLPQIKPICTISFIERQETGAPTCISTDTILLEIRVPFSFLEPWETRDRDGSHLCTGSTDNLDIYGGKHPQCGSVRNYTKEAEAKTETEIQTAFK